jgi:hypothetical protein
MKYSEIKILYEIENKGYIIKISTETNLTIFEQNNLPKIGKILFKLRLKYTK